MAFVGSFFCMSLHRIVNSYQRTISFSLSTLASTTNNETVKSLADLPGPVSLPVLGTAWTYFVRARGQPLGKRILSSQQDDIDKYGSIHKRRLGGADIVRLADPSHVAKVLRSESKYPQRFRIPLLEYYRKKRQKLPGVFFGDGPAWLKHRSVLSKRILRPKQVAEYAPEFNEIISDFIHRLRTVREHDGSDKAYEICGLDSELFKWSFESVALMLFDKRFGCLEPQVNKDAQIFITSVENFLYNSVGLSIVPTWFYKMYETKQLKAWFDNLDTMNEYAELFVERRLEELQLKSSESSGRQDDKAGFIEFVLSSGKLTKDELLASVTDVLFAGVDTTSNTMQWILYMMAKNPDKQDILRQQVLSVLGDETLATPTTLTEMPYLKAWLRETLRLYPVLPALFRKLRSDITLDGYHIPAGTQVFCSLYSMSRNNSIFEDAEKFKPERWLRDKEPTSKFNDAKEVFSSMPFGFGTRMCLGRRIAELELHLLLARIIQNFEIRYPPGEIVEPLARTTIIPDRPLRVQFLDRKA